MKRTLGHIVLSLVAILLTCASCTKNADQNIYAVVTLQLVMDDGSSVESLTVDTTMEGNFFRNYNTYQDYDFPEFLSGKGTLTVLKGMYLISFDGVATLSDGTSATVRCSQYRDPSKAVSLVEDTQTLTLTLTQL